MPVVKKGAFHVLNLSHLFESEASDLIVMCGSRSRTSLQHGCTARSREAPFNPKLVKDFYCERVKFCPSPNGSFPYIPEGVSVRKLSRQMINIPKSL